MVLEYQILTEVLHQQYQLIQQVDLVLLVILVHGSANATVGHGLGSAPQMIILKNRDSAENWIVGNTTLGWTKY
jgi:hypothetical protein